MRITEELATLYKQDRIALDVALEQHFSNIGLGSVDDDTFMLIQLVIGFANVGLMDKIVLLSDEQKTVADIIQEYKLRPFLEAHDS